MTIEGADGGIGSISAVTLATQSIAKSVEFYRSLGFELASGGPRAEFTNWALPGRWLNERCYPDSVANPRSCQALVPPVMDLALLKPRLLR